MKSRPFIICITCCRPHYLLLAATQFRFWRNFPSAVNAAQRRSKAAKAARRLPVAVLPLKAALPAGAKAANRLYSPRNVKSRSHFQPGA